MTNPMPASFENEMPIKANGVNAHGTVSKSVPEQLVVLNAEVRDQFLDVSARYMSLQSTL